MICTKCGTNNDDQAVFCFKCGARLDKLQNNTSDNVSVNNGEGSTQKEQKLNETQVNYIHNNQKNTSTANGFDDFLDNIESFINKILSKFSNLFKNQKKVVVDANNIKESTKDLKLFTLSSNIDTSRVHQVNYNHEYSRLGGFLAFIYYAGLIGIAISLIGLIINIFTTFATIAYAPANIIVLIVTIFNVVFTGMLGFTSLYKLKHKSVDFLHYAVKTCILSGIILTTISYILTLLCSIITISSHSSAQVTSAAISSLVGNVCLGWIIYIVIYCIGMFLLLLYFTKSVRVSTYMGTDVYAKLTPFTKNMEIAKPVTELKNAQQSADFNKQVQNVQNNKSQEDKKSLLQKQEVFNICQYCGAKVKLSNKFCTSCGKPINSN